MGIGILNLAFAQDSATPFTYKFQPDQQETYNVVIDITGNLPIPGGGGGAAGNIKLNTGMFLKVSKMNEDKSAVITTGLNALSGELSGAPLPISLEMARSYIPDTNATVTTQGELKDLKGGGQLPMGINLPGFDPRNLATLLIPTQMPDKKMEKGVSWTFMQKFGEGKDALKIEIKAVCEGMETVDGVELMKITQTFDHPIEVYQDAFLQPTEDRSKAARSLKGTLTGSSKLWFHPEKGVLEKATMAAQIKQVSEPIKTDGSEIKEYEREITEASSTILIQRSTEKKESDSRKEEK